MNAPRISSNTPRKPRPQAARQRAHRIPPRAATIRNARSHAPQATPQAKPKPPATGPFNPNVSRNPEQPK